MNVDKNIFFDNHYRKYFGLKSIDKSVTCKLFEDGFLRYYVYFKNNKIIKTLRVVFNEQSMSLFEKDVNCDVDNDKTVILPKTIKGKPKRISTSVLDNLNGIGTYFFIHKQIGKDGHCLIGNYTTQKSFYEDVIKKEILSEKDLIEWLDEYVENTTDEDLLEIQKFSNEGRKHIKYKEGDYFRVKIGRHEYGYGRILMDITKRKKSGLVYWDVLMGKPLIIEMFHIITKNKNVPISYLKELPTFPSQHIMDNNFYYGDYEIIGNDDLPSTIKYPIMYGKSISGLNPDKIIFQCGDIHKEIDYNNNVIKRKEETLVSNFRNNGIGYTIDINSDVIKNSICDNSNNPFWEYYKYKLIFDLRSPQNKKYLYEVLKQFNLEDLYDKYN